MMRKFSDCQNVVLDLIGIRGRDAYEGLIEGTPRLCRMMRLRRGQDAMKKSGVYVDGLEIIELEIASGNDHWAPKEEWVAQLYGCEDWVQKVIYEINITWYQNSENPMLRLAEIVEKLDFGKYCKKLLIERDLDGMPDYLEEKNSE